MKAGMMCNVVGTIIVVIALVMHIVCLATPYYAVADLSNVEEDMKGTDLSPMERKVVMEIAGVQTEIYYGLWQLCHKSVKPDPDGKCKMWFEEIEGHSIDPGVWMRGAQSMGTIGVIIMAKCGFGTVLNLIVESRGDRKRLLPFIICGFCVAGGFFTFVEDMIMAANYNKFFTFMSDGGSLSQGLQDLLNGEFSLGWGFGLDLLSALLCCIGGILHLVARRFNESGSGLV